MSRLALTQCRVTRTHVFPVRDYDLAATLNSGQAFRWTRPSDARTGEFSQTQETAHTDSETSTVEISLPVDLRPSPNLRGTSWAGVVGRRALILRRSAAGLAAEVAEPIADWSWLSDYLQTGVDLAAVLATFPHDAPMRAAVAACRGLRLLRQDPWECLASFILSSTKQITQIRQIVAELCRRFGEPLAAPASGEVGYSPKSEVGEHARPRALPNAPSRPASSAQPRQDAADNFCVPELLREGAENRARGGRAPHPIPEFVFSFPSAERLARCTETELRACKAGFRAPYLLATARRVASGQCDLARLHRLPLAEARAELVKLPGVGPKIADCTLLFAFGFAEAFPLDVWVLRALGQLYFPRRRVTPRRLREFAATHFGPHAGYAQQYLFHYMRTQLGKRPTP